MCSEGFLCGVAAFVLNARAARRQPAWFRSAVGCLPHARSLLIDVDRQARADALDAARTHNTARLIFRRTP
jgi:hypothetical protein